MNGVRIGIVLSAGATTTGLVLATVALSPSLVVGPPLTVAPVKVVKEPATAGVMTSFGHVDAGAERGRSRR